MNDGDNRLKGKVLIAGGRELRFDSLYEVIIMALDKPWILDEVTPTVIKFRPKPAYWRAKHGIPDDFVLRSWRKHKKFTQEKAADVLGVSISLIQKIEQGQRRLTGTMHGKIAKSADHSLYVRTGRRGTVRIL